MRLPEGERSGKFWKCIKDSLRVEIKSGKENLLEAKEHVEKGGNLIIATNHIDGMDPGVTLNLIEKITSLENVATFVSTHQLDNWYRGPIMTSIAGITGLEIYPTVQNKKRDKKAYEVLFEALQSGPPTNESLQEAKKTMTEAKKADKRQKPDAKDRFPAVDRFNSHYLRLAIKRLTEGHGLITYILPEGTRSTDGTMQEAEEGAAYLIKKVNMAEERVGKGQKTLLLPVAIEIDQRADKLTHGKARIIPLATKSKLHVCRLMSYENIENIVSIEEVTAKDAIMLPIAAALGREQRGFYSSFIKTG